MLKLLSAIRSTVVNPKASSVAPRTMLDRPAIPSVEPRAFHFAVTWVTLFAHLDLIEATGPRRRSVMPSPTLALVPVVVPPPLMDQRGGHNSNADWEMVVPKMIRTGDGNFTPAEAAERRLI